MRRLIDSPATGLGPFFAAAAREYDLAAEHAGAVETQLRFGNWRVRVRIAGAELGHALLGALAWRRDDDPSPADTTISAWEEVACPEGAAPVPWEHQDIEPGGLVRDPGPAGIRAVHETFSGALTLVDAGARSILYRVPGAAGLAWWERAAPLRAPLFYAVRGPGHHLVHAGGAADARGAVLLAGAPGSGKTTVVTAAVEHGFDFIADDYLLLRTDGEPAALSLYSTASVRSQPGVEEKTVVDVSTCRLEASVVRSVVVPHVGGSRTRLRRVSGAVALRAWAPATALHMPFDDGAVVAALAGVVRRVPCFQLEVGDSAAEIATAVATTLGGS